jgi:16S rRNA (guanine(966)-N(2))-methyltransferase RsmD
MRIVTGKFKGREIISPPKSIELRPTSDRVREAIFDVIRFNIADSVFLDLFAGSGAIGIEAISEGARFSVFVEKNPVALRVIKENIKMLGIENQALIIKQDVLNFIKSPFSFESFKEKFDFVFLDPPYASKLAGQTMQALVNFPFLKSDSIIIAEHSDGEILSDDLKGTNSLKKFREKKYGKIAVSYYSIETIILE